jgi:hypothetical protein
MVFQRGKAMASGKDLEQTATSIAALDRSELQRRIRNFRGRFKLDFTEDYLKKIKTYSFGRLGKCKAA